MSTQSPLSHVPTIALSTGKCGSKKKKQRKLDSKAIEPLCASIEHWYENWVLACEGDYLGINISSDGCALCGIYLYESLSCRGCPVRSKSGRPLCIGTPWAAVEENLANHAHGNLPLDISLYEKEYQFLVSLLPDKEEVE